MFHRLPLVALLACLPAQAIATCADTATPIFTCTLKQATKQVEVCLQNDGFSYAYGSPGQAPELTLTALITDGVYRPWSGFGRSIWESLTLRNNEYAYEVGMSFDKIISVEGGDSLSGGIDVQKHQPGGKVEYLVYLECDKGSLSFNTDLVYQAYEDAGLCWDYSDFHWKSECGEY